MTNNNLLSFIVLSLLLLTTGCATKALLDEAQREDKTQKHKTPGLDKITHAFLDGDSVQLCFERTVLDISFKKNLIERYLIDIPLPGNNKWLLSVSTDEKVPFFEAGDDNIRAGVCDVSAKTIPIIDVSTRDNIAIPTNIKHALYVMYKNNNLHGLGYVSSTSLPMENQQIIMPYLDKTPYSFSINLKNTKLYSEIHASKDYLLLLTPITIAIDIIGTALVIYAVLVLEGISH